MLHKTRGLVLRTIKYGETSIICTVFTEVFGVQSYIIQGVRGSNPKQNRAGLLQPGNLLDLVVYQKPQQSLQRIKEFQPAFIYYTIQEKISKNCIAMFSVELLLRLLPEHAPIPELFEFCFEYFSSLDNAEVSKIGNYPVFFLITCSNMLGYTITGRHTGETPHLNLREGGFSQLLPTERPFATDDDAQMLDKLLRVAAIKDVATVDMNGASRFRLLDWLLAFMHNHTQHMGEIRSLTVLRTVLHE